MGTIQGKEEFKEIWYSFFLQRWQNNNLLPVLVQKNEHTSYTSLIQPTTLTYSGTLFGMMSVMQITCQI